MLATRRARHERLSAFLTSCSDVELGALVDAGRVSGVGVGGGSVVLDVNGVPVFAKRIPLTERELSHPHCTGNLFDLPLFCQYGIGGPGFNAWRELAANVIVTDGVLTGETESFPLLYHWRVLPGRPPVAAEHADIDAVVAALDGCSAVRARLEALATASCSLVLFCEYIPHPLLSWLHDDPVTGKPDFASSVLRAFFSLNLLLGTFNLLPVPPLDGSTAVMLFMGETRSQRYLDWLRGNSYAMVGLLLAIVAFRYVYAPIKAFATYYLLQSHF